MPNMILEVFVWIIKDYSIYLYMKYEIFKNKKTKKSKLFDFLDYSVFLY